MESGNEIAPLHGGIARRPSQPSWFTVGTSRRRLGRAIASALVTAIPLLGCGCEKSTGKLSANSSNQAAIEQIDVCGLLKSEEVSRLQTSPIKETKRSASSNGGFLIRQCFYEAADFPRSVNLALTSSDPKAAGRRDLVAFWKEKFTFDPAQASSAPTSSEGAKEGGEEEGREHVPPKHIENLGDDAYWMGRDALYVLKGDVYLRLSIGGREPLEKKMEKARSLMSRALARLPASDPKAER